MADAQPVARTGFVAVMRREYRRMATTPFYLLGMVVFPLVSGLLMIAIFGDGVVRDLPISAVDADGTALSRQIVQMIDATPGLRIAYADRDIAAARLRVLRGESYGLVFVPRDFERDVTRGTSSHVGVYVNAQYILPTSMIRRDTTAAIMTASAAFEAGRRAGSGQPIAVAIASVDPIRVDIQTLFNPSLSYVPYLVVGLLPTLLQIFVMVMAVHAFGVELKHGTAGEWMATAAHRPWTAFAGKMVPYVLHYTSVSVLMLWALFGWLDVPVHGSLAVLTVATVLFVLAYLGMGFAAVALTGNLRLATSLAAFYSVPAFAFAGLAFPVVGMPATGQAWASLLPLTHYVRLIIDCVMRGAPIGLAEPPLSALAAFAVLPWVVLGWRMASLARQPRTWGRL